MSMPAPHSTRTSDGLQHQRLHGVAARQWRRTLAASAERVDDSIRTLKFPLDFEGAISWDAVERLHRTVNTDASDSLIGFLYALIGAGFRVFSKVAQTEAFINARILDDAGWSRQLSQYSALTVASETFVPSMIYQRLLFAPRAVGGKNNVFSAEVIAIEYAKFFCKGKHSDAIPVPERALFDAIGEALAKAFADWKSLTGEPALAAGVIDTVLRRLGYTGLGRTLAERIQEVRPCTPEGTVAFDATAPVVARTDSVTVNLLLARALAVARQEGAQTKVDVTRAAQEFFSGDANHGGLAWTFGRGLVYFRTTSIEQICADMRVPEDRRDALSKVIDSARSIPEAQMTFLGGVSYSGYRASIGGVLGSWIANTISRLYELEAVLTSAPEPLSLPQALIADEDFFTSVHTTPEEITALARRAIDGREAARMALDRLMGKTNGASIADVKQIESYNALLSTLDGLLAQIKNAITKASETASDRKDETMVAHLKGYAFTVPKWIRPMDRINRLDLSPIDPLQVIEQASSEFDVLHAAMHDHYARIVAWAQMSGETLSPLQRIEAREAAYVRSTTRNVNPAEQALRLCLDTIGRGARKCSEHTLRRVAEFFAQADVFTSDAERNRYFFNRQGRLYKAVYDRRPQNPYPITSGAQSRGTQILTDYGAFLVDLRREVMAEPQLSAGRISDLYRLERAHFAMLLQGFPESIPSSLAVPDAVREVFHLPMPVQQRIGREMVSSSVMRHVFNHYYVRLEAIVAVLLRDRFFLRSKFSRAGENTLLYASSADHWKAPDRLLQTDKPIGIALRSLSAAVQSDAGGIDQAGALAELLKGPDGLNSAPARAYLRQAPHDWMIEWPTGQERACVQIDKKGFGSRLVRVRAARLIGSPGYKGVLDRMVSEPGVITAGDAQLLIMQRVTQRALRDPATGRIRVELKPQDVSACVAIPITETRLTASPLDLPNVIGIDLGERGLGYAVMDAQGQLIRRGRVRIESMRRLVRDDHAGQRRRSAVQKFGSAYDRAEERRRENVVGDYCAAINDLMYAHRGVPVLESVAGGASKAIDKVYAAVTEHYTYSTTPTVDAQRKAYWCGASFWKHPTLRQFKFDKTTGKRGSTVDALNIFPGTAVSSYGTSQTCSCCHRNPIEALKETAAAHHGVLQVKAGGLVETASGTLRLQAADPGRGRDSRGRSPLSKALTEGEMRADDVMALARRNLRQPRGSANARDTRQSQYQCLYVDCGEVQHAEENAAENIARKLLDSLPSQQ